MPLSRRLALAGLTAYVAVLVWAVLNPDLAQPLQVLRAVQSEALSAGWSWPWVDRIEFAANVAVVVPLPFLISLAWRERGVAWWTTVSFLLSCLVETVQLLFMAERTASTADVVANTAGGLLGAAGARLVRPATRRLAPRQDSGHRNLASRSFRSDGPVAHQHPK